MVARRLRWWCTPRGPLSLTPPACSRRLQTGRFADGRVFDDRYATEPLVYELGGFYLNGVDEALAGRCVGSKLLLSWPSSPELEVCTTDDLRRLPAGSAIEMEIDVRTIRCRRQGIQPTTLRPITRSP